MELVYKISYHRMQDHYLPKLVQAIRLVSEEDLWKKRPLLIQLVESYYIFVNIYREIQGVIRIQIQFLKMELKNIFQ